MPTAVRNIRLDDILDVTEHWVNIIHLNCGTVLRTKKNRGELKWTLFRIRQDYTQYHENWIHINRRGVSSYFLIAVSSTTKGPCTKIWPAVYSWIGRPVRTHKTSICRETKRATPDLNIRMKSSQRGASNGGGQKNHIFILWRVILKK